MKKLILCFFMFICSCTPPTIQGVRDRYNDNKISFAVDKNYEAAFKDLKYQAVKCYGSGQDVYGDIYPQKGEANVTLYSVSAPMITVDIKELPDNKTHVDIYHVPPVFSYWSNLFKSVEAWVRYDLKECAR